MVFFDDRNVRTTKIEGEADIDLALKTGAIHRVVKEYVEKRVELKVTERIAQDFMRGASARQRLKREAEIEYERKLKEEMERKELVRQKEERRRLEDEKQKRIDDERREEEELARRRRALEEKRNRVEEDLLLMDLSSAKPRDIMRKMDEGGISHVGATSKEDLLAVLKSRFPKVKQKLENAESGWGVRLSIHVTHVYSVSMWLISKKLHGLYNCKSIFLNLFCSGVAVLYSLWSTDLLMRRVCMLNLCLSTNVIYVCLLIFCIM